MPWCVRKCPYCDFNSHQLKSAAPDAAYIDALIRDFERECRGSAGRRIDSVFFGGGTPSLFAPEDFARLLGALAARIEFAGDAEITLEANPGTIERGRFAGYRRGRHQSRVAGRAEFRRRMRCSAWAASIRPRTRTARSRSCSAAETRQFQSRSDVRAAASRRWRRRSRMCAIACALEPAHISYYQLTLEPGTVFHSRPPPLPDEDAAWQIQVAGQAAAGGGRLRAIRGVGLRARTARAAGTI